MKQKDFYTIEAADSVFESEPKEYRRILRNLSDQQEQWSTIIESILAQNHYTITKFADLCEVSRAAVHKWRKGSVPQNRETFLKIGFAAGYTLDEMNLFLTRYGRYPGLYAKSLEDSVCIFVLSSDAIEHSYHACREILHLIRTQMTNADTEASLVAETSAVITRLVRLSSVKSLLDFVSENAGVYRRQYHRLYDYIKTFLKMNLLNDSAGEDTVSLLADSQQWSSSLRQCVSAVSQNKWYPQRNKIISLGIHLNMTAAQINTMFSLAQMEPLYAKNPLEGAILYALKKAEMEGEIQPDGTDSLCLYVKHVLEELHFTDCPFYQKELSIVSYEDESV